jgi:exodeoxyribonuclease V alpha subunit
MLAELQAAGLLDTLDVELARALGRLSGGVCPEVELAIALTSRNVRLGHSCFPIGTSVRDLWPKEGPAPELPEAKQWKRQVAENPLSNAGPIVLDQSGRLYLRRYWQLEKDIARELASRSTTPATAAEAPPDLESSLRRLFPGGDDSLQRRAALNALRHSVSLLCGGPGTGKTTTVAAIVALIIEQRLQASEDRPRVLLLAPTGKSAARLGEAVRKAKGRIDASPAVLAGIPEEATTVHRALGMRRDGVRFRRNANLPLEADVVVLDEASMVDLGLMRQLLDAAPRHATLLIVGDPDQLTSVEAGSVLRDLVTASNSTWWSDRATQLSKTYRYDQDQPLGRLVAAIRSGDTNAVSGLLEQDDADGVHWSSSKGLAAELDRAAVHWSPALLTEDPVEHFELRERYVMLSPFRRGAIGTERLGAAVADRLRTSEGGESAVTPIIIEENSQELRVFNGDFAMLVDSDFPVAFVQSEAEGFPEIVEARLPRYSNAFALSVHKAQGSEFDEVLVVLPEEDAPMLSRELLYTAVSRARHRVRLVGPKEVIAAAVSRKARRYSGLVDAIADAG